jgi:hypothetical protein
MMKTTTALLAALCTLVFGPCAHADDPCIFSLVSVPEHASSGERIGLRLVGGIYFAGAGPGVAQVTMRSNTLYLDVVQTRDRDAFPGYHPIGDIVQDVFSYVGPMAAGSYPVVVTSRSFVDGVTNVTCPEALETLTVGTDYEPGVTVDAVEFYNTLRDRYHVTADPGEILYLDGHGEPGWARTGRGFKVYALGSSNGRGYVVSRFFSSRIDGHFLTASYREFTVVSGTPEWQLEGTPFELALPDTLTGECPDRTTPVYRLFNPKSGDHRYTTDGALKAGLVSQGWIAEGYGDAAVAMCAPLT